jgi:kynurenine 3-monooxygenase
MDSTENWGELFQKFSNVRKFDTDAIGELALENYIEMRGLVNQNIFFKKKELERELEMTYPNRFISRYSMVSFHQIPYSIVKARGIIQEKILSTFSSSSSSVSMKNYKEIEEMIFEELPSLDQL